MAENYRLSHQAPGPEEDRTTISLDQVGSLNDEVFPPDVLENPKNYGLRHSSTAAALDEARGNPEAEIRVWRAVPNGITTINPGDWVSLSKAYAEAEAQTESAKVISATVKASELWSEGLLEEWGYQGKTQLEASSEPGRRHKILESFPTATSERSQVRDTQSATNRTSAIRATTKTSELGY